MSSVSLPSFLFRLLLCRYELRMGGDLGASNTGSVSKSSSKGPSSSTYAPHLADSVFPFLHVCSSSISISRRRRRRSRYHCSYLCSLHVLFRHICITSIPGGAVERRYMCDQQRRAWWGLVQGTCCCCCFCTCTSST